MRCTHERWEQIAAADGGESGGCPLCMSEEIDRLRVELADQKVISRALLASTGEKTALHACKCPKPLIGERPGGYARCRLCNGYITALYIINLQNQIGALNGQSEN